MTYFNAVKYIRIAPMESSGEDTMTSLLLRLGNPQKRMRYMRLAGSNGKTVCAEMLSSVLTRAGYTVGCLRMPPREDPRDNICIGGQVVDIDVFCDAVARVKAAVQESETLTPSRPEILLAAALILFDDAKCDLAIIESDHFGEDPSLALPPPFAAVICGTIPNNNQVAISRIRSYICRGIEEIVGAPQDSEAYKIISDTCYSVNCRLTLPNRSEMEVRRLSFRGTDFCYKGGEFSVSLCGRFQVQNAMLALEVIDMLSRKGFEIKTEHVHEGFGTLRIPAKLEVVSLQPLIIIDSTHTPYAVATVTESLAEFRDQMGKSIRLCLPSTELAKLYTTALTKWEYEIEGMVISETEEKNTPKAIAKRALAELDKDTVLLVSGDYPFVSAVRYELLALLGF